MTMNQAAAGAGQREPLRLIIDAQGALVDFGIFELYEDAGEQLARRIEDARDGLMRSAATPAEQARLADIEEVLAHWGPVIQGDVRRGRAAYLLEEWESTVQSAIRRAETAGDPLCEALAAAQTAERQLRILWEHDRAAYRDAYEAAVRLVLAERGNPVDMVEFVDALSDEAPGVGDESGWETLDSSIHARVVQLAPLPMTGEAPPDWRDGMPAEDLRRARLTYLERATADSHPGGGGPT